MGTLRRLFLGAGVVLALFVGLAWLGLEVLGRGMCGNEILTEVPSLDGRYKAVVFQRDCGATTGFSTQVSLLPQRKKLPNDGGNLFVADTDHGRAPSGPGGGPAVQVQWVNDQHLLLIHHPAARVFRAEQRRGGIHVEYRTE